jgi:hypothetical protein
MKGELAAHYRLGHSPLVAAARIATFMMARSLIVCAHVYMHRENSL